MHGENLSLQWCEFHVCSCSNLYVVFMACAGIEFSESNFHESSLLYNPHTYVLVHKCMEKWLASYNWHISSYISQSAKKLEILPSVPWDWWWKWKHSEIMYHVYLYQCPMFICYKWSCLYACTSPAFIQAHALTYFYNEFRSNLTLSNFFHSLIFNKWKWLWDISQLMGYIDAHW